MAKNLFFYNGVIRGKLELHANKKNNKHQPRGAQAQNSTYARNVPSEKSVLATDDVLKDYIEVD